MFKNYFNLVKSFCEILIKPLPPAILLLLQKTYSTNNVFFYT